MWVLLFLILVVGGLAIWMWKRQYPVVRDQAHVMDHGLVLEGIDAQLSFAQQLLEKNTSEAQQRAYHLYEELGKKYELPDAYVAMAQIKLAGQGCAVDFEAALALLEKAYQCGSDVAPYHLAQIYADPQRSVHNQAQAQYWLQHAIARGNLDAQHYTAQQYAQNNDLAKADEVLKQAAENGHAISQYELAMHLLAQSPADVLQARHWLSQASEQNYLPAIEQLGQLCRQHKADPAYRQQAFELLKKRAAQGDQEAEYGYQLAVLKQAYDAEQILDVVGRIKTQAQQKDRFAQTLLGTAYYHGWGVGQNQRMAFRYWSQAAHSNEPIALCHIANLYQQGELVEQDQAKAFELFSYADQLQSTDFSQLSLALCYLYGQGVAQDQAQAMQIFNRIFQQHFDLQIKTKADLFYGLGLFYAQDTMPLSDSHIAEKYFRQAIAEQHLDAMYALAQCYLEPMAGFAQDEAQASTYLLQAANMGHVLAMHQLGNLYLIGRGIDKDEQHARVWLERAVAQQHTPAMNDLAEIYEYGWGVEIDPERALQLYQTAADALDAEACYQLGRLYLEGNMCKRDYAQARAWLKKSAGLGLLKADTLYQSILQY